MTESLVHKSTFPPPPPFYTLYTKEALANQPQILQPPPPLNESFIKFGAVQSDDFLVHDLGSTPQLYNPDDSISRSLRSLCRSTAQTFIELLDALLDKQTQLPDRLTQLRCLFINIAHVLNKLRAHQARQTIILLLQKQIKSRRQRISQLQAQSERAKEFLSAHGLGEDGMLIDDAHQQSTPTKNKPKPIASSNESLKNTEQQALLDEVDQIWASN